MFVRFEIVEGDTVEVRQDHIARQVVGALLARKILNVVERLRLGLVERFAAALVLGEHHAAPEQVDVAVLTVDLADGLLERGQQSPANAEHAEELVPEGFRLRVLTVLLGPFARKADGVLADIVPTDRHAGVLWHCNGSE